MHPDRPGQLAAALLAVTVALASVAAAAAVPCGELFVLRPLSEALAEQPLEPAYVDGMALQIPWRAIEPEAGRYDWRLLDEAVAAAGRHGKRVTLHVLPLRPPEWLFAAGAESLSFTMTRPDSPLYGRELREVLPWDPVYLERWSRLTAKLGKRYAGNRALFAVSVTAPAPEMVLPGAIPNTPAFEELRRRYRKDVYLAAWKRMIDVYQAAFPDTPKLLVPGIVLMDERFADEVVDYARRRYGDRLWLFNTGLRADGVPQAGMLTGHIAQLLTAQGGRGGLGLQTIWSASDDPHQRMRGTLRQALDRGLAMGGSYFELYASDVLNPQLQTELATFKRQLDAESRCKPADAR